MGDRLKILPRAKFEFIQMWNLEARVIFGTPPRPNKSLSKIKNITVMLLAAEEAEKAAVEKAAQ